MALDERLRRGLEEAGRPADPSGVYEDLIRRRERRRITRRLERGVLAMTVLAGCVVGVVLLAKVFVDSPTRPGATPRPSPTPAPTRGEDIGLGFGVCNVSSIDGHFVSPDETATVFVATKAGDTRDCPQPEEAFNVVALDADGDGLADSSFGPIGCTLECRAFAAPDVDSDGTDELLVVQDGGVVVGLRLYDVSASNGQPQIVPVEVADPGDPNGGFQPGEQASFLLGGDAFSLYAMRCDALPSGSGLVATSAEELPNDSPDAQWHAHETTFLLEDGTLRVVDTRDFTEPVSGDPNGPSFRTGKTLCGVKLGPIPG